MRALMPKDRFLILTYHRVVADEDPLRPAHPTAAVFEAQLRALAASFRVLDLAEAIRLARESRLPRGSVAITFDDGYKDNVDVALPVLRRFGFPATFFVATGYLNGGAMWNDVVVESLRRGSADRLDLEDIGLGRYELGDPAARRAAIMPLIRSLKYLEFGLRKEAVAKIRQRCNAPDPPELMMTDDDVRSMRAAGMTVGAHTVTHPILSRVDAREAQSEITSSRQYLEDLLGERIAGFAYPNGRRGQDYDKRDVAAVREAGFDYAVSTDPGCATASSDVFQLPRFSLWERSSLRARLRLAKNFLGADRV